MKNRLCMQASNAVLMRQRSACLLGSVWSTHLITWNMAPHWDYSMTVKQKKLHPSSSTLELSSKSGQLPQLYALLQFSVCLPPVRIVSADIVPAKSTSSHATATQESIEASGHDKMPRTMCVYKKMCHKTLCFSLREHFMQQ